MPLPWEEKEPLENKDITGGDIREKFAQAKKRWNLK